MSKTFRDVKTTSFLAEGTELDGVLTVEGGIRIDGRVKGKINSESVVYVGDQAEIEADILDFANRAQDGKLTMEEITGGTFSITNGGVFGSMLSTPILNPPQSAILGMHSIKDRPVVENGEVVVRPIMYLALTYDHRIVDGKSAVTFLKTIAELLEDPAAMLLDL